MKHNRHLGPRCDFRAVFQNSGWISPGELAAVGSDLHMLAEPALWDLYLAANDAVPGYRMANAQLSCSCGSLASHTSDLLSTPELTDQPDQSSPAKARIWRRLADCICRRTRRRRCLLQCVPTGATGWPDSSVIPSTSTLHRFALATPPFAPASDCGRGLPRKVDVLHGPMPSCFGVKLERSVHIDICAMVTTKSFPGAQVWTYRQSPPVC